MKLTFLGTGTSIGVPEMLCPCPVCHSDDPHDNRLRASAFIETEKAKVLIDCGPDFRQQVLRYGIDRIDVVLVTHEHYDHVGGIDDLRPFCATRTVPVYAEQLVIDHLMERIPYCFGAAKYPGTPTIELREIHPGGRLEIGDVSVLPLRVMHGNLPILGFLINGRTAYITDMKSIEDSQVDLIKGVDTLIVNALHTKEHPTHQNLQQAIFFAERVGARRTFFIHMSHRIGFHAWINARLPQGMALAHDGLTITL